MERLAAVDEDSPDHADDVARGLDDERRSALLTSALHVLLIGGGLQGEDLSEQGPDVRSVYGALGPDVTGVELRPSPRPCTRASGPPDGP